MPASAKPRPRETLRVAVQMEDITRIKIAGDSTFALMLEAQIRGHQLFTYTPERLSLSDGRVVARVRRLRCAMSRVTMSRWARRSAPTFKPWMWCCSGRIRPSIWPM